MVETLNSWISLLKSVKNIFSWILKQKTKKSLPAVSDRFIHLFERHGVHRNQIPEYLGHGITLQAVSCSDELHKVLTPEHLQHAANLFGVRQDWLECVSEIIYDVPDFYKRPEKFEDFVIKLKKTPNELWCYVVRTQESLVKDDDSDAAFLFVETIGSIRGREIVRYHPVGHLRIGYWKSRADFAANCAVLIKHSVLQVGKHAHRDWLVKINNGTEIPVYDFENRSSALSLSSVWYIDEFFERPELFLQGVDPEHNNFGKRSAVARWLHWSEQGFFDVFNDNSHENCKKAFIKTMEELGK